MLLNHVENSSAYYNYGEIGYKIISDSFSWKEEEEINLLPVLEFLEAKSKKKYMYLITTYVCLYPLGSKDKYLRLWKRLSKEYDSNFDETFEKGIEAKRFYMYLGVARITQYQMKIAIQILQKQFYTSCIVLSDENKRLNNLLNEYIESYLEKDLNCANFANIINIFCVKDEVITAITGYNGTSINYFYFQSN